MVSDAHIGTHHIGQQKYVFKTRGVNRRLRDESGLSARLICDRLEAALRAALENFFSHQFDVTDMVQAPFLMRFLRILRLIQNSTNESGDLSVVGSLGVLRHNSNYP